MMPRNVESKKVISYDELALNVDLNMHLNGVLRGSAGTHKTICSLMQNQPTILRIALNLEP